jgi:hypothetical protein
MTLRIVLTRDNGCTREALYTVPYTKEFGHDLFDKLVAQAFTACYGGDVISREASYYTPEA